MTRTERKHTRTFINEIERRGGETGIDHSGYGRKNKTEFRPVEIVDTDRSEGRKVWLLHAEGWRYYSCSFGSRPGHVSYLCGYDDNGPWAARVPGTLTSVTAAIEWLTPVAVVKARRAGKRVLRQGDVYVVETVRRCDGSGTARNWRSLVPQIGDTGAGAVGGHEWHARARVLIHHDPDRAHTPLRVPFAARFIQQSAYGMGRGAGIGGAD